jgi:SAM-dependent MidA family methyltransferase
LLTPLPLPPLSPDEQAHVQRVLARLREAIAAAGGWLPFAEYMRLALYAPGLGYYSAGAHKFGAAGDFVTAPELTPVFAGCVARSVAGVLDGLGGGDIVELGAGSGVLAADLLQALAARGALPRRYRIVEVSADLRERQRATLAGRVPGLAPLAEWLDAPPAESWQGVLVANEVADALPVERVRITAAGLEQCGVVAQAAGAGPPFALDWRAAAPPVARQFAALIAGLPEPLARGYATEFAPAAAAWLATAISRLERGAAYVIDYGLTRAQYYHPSRAGGTLCGFFRHRRHEDPFLHPGLSDLTAWVDFTTLATAGLAAGFEVAGYATQAHFLLSTGLDRELEATASHLDDKGRAALAQAAAMLVLPGEMGERFKVLVLSRGLAAAPAGFEFRDLAATL